MKKHYTELWLLLACAFAIFAVASAFEMPVIAGHQLKSSEIHSHIFGKNETAVPLDSVVPHTAAAETADKAPSFPVPCDTASKTILFIGDSMLEGLGPRMAAYAQENGHIMYQVTWYSSTSEVWGRSDKLKGYIERLHPDYIFICLGANELFVSDIATKRDKYVKKIIADIDTIPFLWIGPPNWKKDTGINDLIRANAPLGSFFLSDGMHFDRSKDGAHPTRTSAALWMDSVARWMPLHSNHPIRMAKPAKTSARPKRIFVHQPNEK